MIVVSGDPARLDHDVAQHRTRTRQLGMGRAVRAPTDSRDACRQTTESRTGTLLRVALE